MNKFKNTDKTKSVSPIRKLDIDEIKSRPSSFKKFTRKVVLYTKVFTALVILLALTAGFFVTKEYLETHTFTWQEPVVIRTPLIIERIKLISPEATKSATESAKESFLPTSIIPKAYAMEDEANKILILSNAKNAGIVWRIYQLESSFGKGDGCHLKGLYNGFGYAQPDSAMAEGTGACFKSFEEVVAKVDQWFTKQLTVMDIKTSLCYYNTGHKIDDCGYLQKYLNTL